MRKTLGILGGMGPLATVEFMQKIISLTPASNDQQHIPMLVSNNPSIPDRTAFITGKGADPFPALMNGMEQLQQAGVGCIVMPCNTAHYWYEKLSSQCNVKTISIIDSVVCEARQRHYRTVGIMATDATMLTGMYQNRLAACGIDSLEPARMEQAQVMEGIYEVKSGNVQQGASLMLPVFESLLKQGADAVILGCTETPIALAKQVLTGPQQCLDSLEILAKACIEWSCEDEAELVV